MTDLNRRWVVAFNGEIYNHQVLRAELETRGCIF
jgi:asparagine synthetase B (glutamine-hydrolysing)